MDKLTLYHGSTDIIEKPVFGKGKTYNDYGQGFYCSNDINLAREWAVLEGIDGYVNKYTIDKDSLLILNLCDSKYSILHWLTILTENRKFKTTSPIMKRGMEWLQKNYHLDASSYDAIIGYRADDSYFSFAKAFLTNQITLNQLSYAMELGRLGKQFVLMSKKAFDVLHYEGYETVDSSIYYVKRKARDEQARSEFFRMLEKAEKNGIYLRDIMDKEDESNESI